MRKFIYKSEDAFDIAVGLQLIPCVDRFTSQGFSGAPLTIDTEIDITTVPEAQLDTTTVVGIKTVYFPSNDGEAMEIVSTSALDIGPVEIHALTSGGVYIAPFSITLQGLTPVPLPGLLSRVKYMRNSHPPGIFGTVTVRAASVGRTFINMTAQHQHSTQARYTIPAGKKGILKTAIGSMRKQGGVDTALAILINQKPFDFTKFYHPFGFGLQRGGTTTISLVDAYPEAINGPFDVALSAQASKADTEASGRISGLIIDV